MEYRGLQLDGFQEEAITHLHNGDSVLVAAPTGTGKTIIADWIVEEALKLGKQVVYTAPVKALSNQKYRDYVRLYGEDNVGLVTGDLVIRRDAPCRVMTTEILRNMLLADEPMTKLHAVIIDEVHFLDDPERGTVWEEVLIYLPPEVLIVALSATVSNMKDFASWLADVRGKPVKVVRENERAVPLTWYMGNVETGLMDRPRFDAAMKRQSGTSGRRRGQQGRNQQDRRGRGRGRDSHARRTTHVDLFHMCRDNDLLPYLYFVFSRKDTEQMARALSRKVNKPLLNAAEQDQVRVMIGQFASDAGRALEPDVRELLEKGIAFHHAGVHVYLKTLVETLYEQRLIRVLYCTSTFALGINMPARTVVFDGLFKYNGQTVAPLSTRQIMQKAGRAGRRGMDETGHVVIRMDPDNYGELKPLLERYEKGAYEPVKSGFNLSWNSVVNLLDRQTLEQIREITDKSFLSWHLRRQAERHLRRAEHLESEGADRSSAKQAKRLRQRAGRSDNRVWHEFELKVRYLQNIGYLDEDNGFNAGAKLLQHLQISEIMVTELLLNGYLEDLDLETLFGVMCGLTNDLPRGVRRNYKIGREDRGLIREIQDVRWSEPVVGAEELGGQPAVWCGDLIPIGRAWAQGKSLVEIELMLNSLTDYTGSLVAGFRRAKDLLTQVRDAVAQDKDRADTLSRLAKRVSRDEVMVIG